MFGFKKIVETLLIISFFGMFFIKGDDFKQEIYKNNERIRELYISEGKLDSEIRDIEHKLIRVSEKISEKQKKINDYTNEINSYEDKIINLNKVIEKLNLEISAIEDNISKNTDEIKSFEGEIEKFKKVIDNRLKNFYKHMDTYKPLVDLFYTSENVFDLMDRALNMSKFIKVDREVIEKVLKNIDDIKIKNQNIELQKKLIQDKIKLVNENISKNDINLKILDENRMLQQKEIEDINKLNDELKNEYGSLSNDKKLIRDEIIRIHQDNYKLQEEMRKYLKSLNEDNKSVNTKVNYGRYLKPAKGSITSKYGKRVHPVTGKESFHTGIDIGGSKGNNVVSSLSGKVVSSGWYNNIYGNVVIINHGNNIQTFYAHLDKVLVKKNDIVNAGDVVGKMGTTGLSTGPHVHFEIRVNGEHVDPSIRIR